MHCECGISSIRIRETGAQDELAASILGIIRPPDSEVSKTISGHSRGRSRLLLHFIESSRNWRFLEARGRESKGAPDQLSTGQVSGRDWTGHSL